MHRHALDIYDQIAQPSPLPAALEVDLPAQGMDERPNAQEPSADGTGPAAREEGVPSRESCIALSTIGHNSRTPAPAARGERGCQLGSAEQHRVSCASFP